MTPDSDVMPPLGRPSPRIARPAGALLLHPVFLAAVAVLVLNDHVLKRAVPSALTGKFSDFSGVFVLPLVLQAVYERAVLRMRARAPAVRASNRVLFVSAIATMVGFALPELSRSAELAYQIGLGALQWPVFALNALWSGQALPAIAPVAAVADPTDLLALPMACVALGFGWQRARSPERGLRLRALTPWTLAFAVFLAASPVDAEDSRSNPERADHARTQRRGKKPYTHDGFFVDGNAGIGALFVGTESSISNGFQQRIASGARGPLLLVDVSMGGTVQPGWVLAARLAYGEAREPVISTLGESFQLRDFKLVVSELSALARYYPNPTRGLNFGAGLGVVLIHTDGDGATYYGTGAARTLGGPSISIEAGNDFWLSRQFSVGPAARLVAAYMFDSDAGNGTVFMPTLLIGLTWH